MRNVPEPGSKLQEIPVMRTLTQALFPIEKFGLVAELSMLLESSKLPQGVVSCLFTAYSLIPRRLWLVPTRTAYLTSFLGAVAALCATKCTSIPLT